MKLVCISVLVAARLFISILVLSALAVAIPQVGFAQSDPFTGTWKLNLARSTYTAGSAPRSTTVTYQGAGETLTGTIDTIDAQGQQTRVVFMRIYDGKSHPVTGSPDFDARAYTRVDANTSIFANMKEGKLVGVGISVLSQDGRTNTTTFRGNNAAGQQLNNVTVNEKQQTAR
jgi:hypothetical protein